MQLPTLPIADLIPCVFVSCEGAARTLWLVVGNFFLFFQVLKIFLMIKQLLFQTTHAPFQNMHDFSVCLYCLVMSSKFNFLAVQFALHSVVVSVPFVNLWYFAVNQVKFTCKVFFTIYNVSKHLHSKS